MQLRYVAALSAALLALSSTKVLASDAGNPEIGRQVFQACAACHSLVPGRHMTGPSLSSIWGRKAGTVEGFTRYSDALKQADIKWDEPSLDAWLKNPKTFIPNNRMTIRGLQDKAQRRDLIAFLRSVSQEQSPASSQQAESMPEGMMSQGQMLNLKELEANNHITSISHCGDTYTVIAETGEVYELWEFNLRFKTDSSVNGPASGGPVIIPASMRGDRAFVIFASPVEISPFIQKGC